MRIYYLDTENIGFNLLEEIALSILDRIFVFSNSEAIKSACLNSHFTCINGYPAGQNQADFYIIAHLSSILSHINKAEKKAVEFILLSKDQQLWKAFSFQAHLAGVKCAAPYIALENDVQFAPAKIETSLEQKILTLAKAPLTVVKLNISDSVFTSTFNQLIKAKKIKRVDNSKRKWLAL